MYRPVQTKLLKCPWHGIFSQSDKRVKLLLIPLIILIASIALSVFLGAIYWGCALWPWIKKGKNLTSLSYWRQTFLALPLVFVAMAILRADAMQLLGILSPPAGLLMLSDKLRQFSAFSWPLIVSSAMVFAATSFFLRKQSRNLSIWRPVISVLAAIAAFAVRAELRTKILQRHALEIINFDCVDHKTFSQSLRLSGAELQFNLHTAGRKGSDIFGWSFKTLEFYKLPPNVRRNIQNPC